jgi:hypothetical protein
MMHRERLNEYANSMFRYERLHSQWIERCTKYLEFLWGGALAGKTVIDYGFGRGNWSVAFLKAGVEKVIAIDASKDNVDRFHKFCCEQRLTGIEIIHGDALIDDIGAQGDLIWLYGVLPLVAQADKLIIALRAMATDSRTKFHVYAYDAGSLRQLIVEIVRAGIVCRDENEFSEISCSFTPAARLRARDDLTAPYLHWYAAKALEDLLRRCGLYVISQSMDFHTWTHGTPSEEFNPYLVLCGFHPESACPIVEPNRAHQGDIVVLRNLADKVTAKWKGTAQDRLIRLGLFNTHFSALPVDGNARSPIVEDFLYLLHAAMRAGLRFDPTSDIVASYFDLAVLALAGLPRTLSTGAIETKYIAPHLLQQTIRI